MIRRTRILVCVLLLSIIRGEGQSYGLQFSSHEVVNEKRTSLDLSPAGPLCLKDHSELSFVLMFSPHMSIYFGYVFRLISGNENIDMVYDQREGFFKFVLSEKICGTFRPDSLQLYTSGIAMRVVLDKPMQTVTLYAAGKKICSGSVRYDNCVKILFGANDFSEFQTADLPPMSLRDIRIFEEASLSYFWPLAESAGSETRDQVKQSVARITNAHWVKPRHQHWVTERSLQVDGFPAVAFDSKKGTLYLTSQDSIYRMTARNGHWDAERLSQRRDTVPAGSQSVFDTSTGRLVNFYIDQKKVATYNFSAKKWEGSFTSCVLTEFWQANKFISPVDSSLYMFGGYGQLTYKNAVQRYSFANGSWEKLAVKGDFFVPRYLASLGCTPRGDTAYVLGGYGSNSGYQVVNPRYLYDLMSFDVKTATFKTVYRLKEPLSHFCFSNSLVVDPVTRSYFALIYPNKKFNSSLQLIQGSLDVPNYRILADSIPYSFYDVGSFCDLFYSPADKKLVVATLYNTPENKTSAKIYSIDFPPDPLAPVPETPAWGTSLDGPRIVGIMAFLFLIVGSAWGFRHRKNALGLRRMALALKQETGATDEDLQQMNSAGAHATRTNVPAGETAPGRARIYLFGPFEVFDKNGEDLTKLFTPLLKDMFLLVAGHCWKHKTGISSSRFYEALWPGKTYKDAQNNRSVNMVKLKTILDRIGAIAIGKEADRWVLTWDEKTIYSDFAEFMDLTENKKYRESGNILRLLSIIKRGGFLSGIEQEWLDDIKSDVAGSIIDMLHEAITIYADDFELQNEIANGIFHFDPINEEALHVKCKSLNLLGRHSLAKSAYDKFLKEYKHMYGKAYEETFQEVIGGRYRDPDTSITPQTVKAKY